MKEVIFAGIAALILAPSCVTNRQKDCTFPGDCAPFHHSGGNPPAPNIARPLEKGQTIRVFPNTKASSIP